MKFNKILCRLGETALKGEYTRRYFENILVSNINKGFKSSKIDFSIKKEPGRLFITTKEVEKSCIMLKKIFGLTSISPIKEVVVKANMKKLVDSAEKFAKGYIRSYDTFAVRARRTGNDSFTSNMIERKVGEIIVNTIGSKVNLDNPDKTLYIEVRQNKVYFFNEKMRCPGGLPLGTQGSVIVLFSGGIDSAVAAWMIMKRGCKVSLLYIDQSPFVSQKINIKRVNAVYDDLKEWSIGHHMKIISVNTGKAMEEIKEKCEDKLTCLLCKRMMYRIAEKICDEKKIKVIVTGENLGQVASQTLDNLVVLNQATMLPVLRPLICLDKEEIMKIAKDIGTYESSIISTGGCSAVPDSPRTKGNIKELLTEEENLDVTKLVENAAKTAKTF